MRHRSMLLWPKRWVVAGAACLCGSSLCAAETPISNPVQPETIARWIQELDADAYPVRERASNQLREAGPAAVELLAQAVADPSVEVATRASAILQRIADGNDEQTLNQIAAALKKIGSKRAAVRMLVADIAIQQQRFKHTRAVAQVRALGGGLTGNWGGEPTNHVEAVFLPPPIPLDAIEILPAVAVEDVPAFEAPAIDPIPAIEVPIEGPAPAKRGLAGLLARLIAPAVAPAPPAEFFPVPADVPEPPAAPDAVPLAPLAEVEGAPAGVPRFDLVPALPADPAPVEEVPAVAEAAIGADIAVEEFAIIEPAFAPLPIFFDGEGDEAEAYAELILDQSFRGSDKDLAVLKDIPEIYSLSINGAKLTDEALAHIGALPRLTTLNVQGTPFSAGALRKLREQRPELSIICRSSAMLGINAGLDGPCVLTSVFFKSGAHDAGLRDGDEIIEVGGQKVRDFSDLTIAVYPHRPGDKLSVKFRRDNDEQTVEVLLKPRAAAEE